MNELNAFTRLLYVYVANAPDKRNEKCKLFLFNNM